MHTKKIPFPAVNRSLLLVLIIGCFFIRADSVLSQEQTPYLPEEGSLGIKLYCRSLQPGEVILLQIPNSSEIQEISAILFGRKLNFWEQGGYLNSLIGIELTAKAGDYILDINVGYKNGLNFNKKYKITISDKEFGTQKLSVDPRYIHLTSEDLARIQQERVVLRRIYASSSEDRLWDASFMEPLNSKISSSFGLRRIFNNQPRGRHYGIDLSGELGTPVKSSNAGKVVLSQELFFAGKCIIIDHGEEIFSIYCHLSKLIAQEGEFVEKGEIIGLVGATGRVTGPHLHWGIKIDGIYISPYSLIHLKLE